MLTVQDIIYKLTEPVDPPKNTVDTLKFGDPYAEVKGIVTAFMATHNVIRQAIAIKANLLITHEGMFYSHQDHTKVFENDQVYQEKLDLIEESKLAIFRFHDYWHRYRPDGIMAGLIQALGWQAYVDKHLPTATLLHLPSVTLREVAEEVKRKLGIPFLRVTGNLSMCCERVGLLVGYRGNGNMAIPLFENEALDLIIVGEGPEWETPEYVRDATFQGRNRASITLGHAESEAPGMRYLAKRLQLMFPMIPVHFISEQPLFHVI